MSERTAVERAFGAVCFVVAALIFGAGGFYVARSPHGLRDPLVLGAFTVVIALALLCGSLGLWLASSSKRTQELGCAGALLSALPLLLIVVFLVWSLFQTTRAVPR